MPNWTQNHVSFEGSKEKIIELKELFASDKSVFDFNKVVPMPEDSEDFQATGSLSMDEKNGNNNWYFWSIKNWGTKWNAVEPNLDVDEDTKLVYSFRTAWDAPRGVIDALYKNGSFNGCTDVNWECAHEFEDDVEVILQTKKNEQEST
tara:strand:+ start:542 stop:985 length:444 start_codon:yes stop_codon:yes gene_type:complete